MVEHVRKAIRAAAKTDLTGLVTTGANVFTSRTSPLASTEMPGMYVMLRDEISDWDVAGTIARTGDLIVEAWAEGGDGLEDKLDRIAAEVEAKIYAAAGTLMALLMNIGPPTTQMELPAGDDASRRIGIIRMRFPVTYRTQELDPTTIV